MLLDYLVDFCDNEYRNADLVNICEECEHPFGCPGGCEGCLDGVHYQHTCSKREYDCINMLNFYVCKYSHKYCSEIQYALDTVKSLKKKGMFNIMSIGCGPCPDLMALEYYRQKHEINIPINYCGYEKNDLWQSVHNEIEDYGQNNGIITEFNYVDVVQHVKKYWLKNDFNLIILQYLISYFYSTGQISEINRFFDDLVNSIFTKRITEQDLVIIINDVNSNRRGRDFFDVLVEKLIDNGLQATVTKRYFDHNIINEYQRYGERYHSCKNLHHISQEIREKYMPAIYCSSAQLIIEVSGEK